MDIVWYGHACFRLREKDAIAVTDPYDRSVGTTLKNVRADIVTVSQDNPAHNNVAVVKGDPKVFTGPGEYEVKNIFITGTTGNRSGARSTMFMFSFDGLRICHLGCLSQVPNQAQVEALSEVGVLLIPVGGGGALDAAKAAEVVSLLEPHIVVPMMYAENGNALGLEPVDKFLKEMGIPAPELQDDLKVTKDSLPEETKVVLLRSRNV